MSVWHWVQQHRLLTVIVLAIFMIGTAGGTAWALVFRTVSSPVGLAQALRMYRREQTGKVLTSLRNHLPASGVYTYRTEGGEGLSILGVQRSFPATSDMVVTDGSCATVDWVPIEQHTEDTTLCPAAGGSYTVPVLATYESIAGTTSTSTVRCPSGTYLLPPVAAATPRWSATCTLSDPAEKVAFAGQLVGPATLSVGGQSVHVEHVRIELTFAGAQQGTNPTDFWLVPGTGLVVREQEQVSVTSGGVHYSETMQAALDSLRPAG